MLCRFYGLPERGNADMLAHRAAECVARCKTRLVIVDVHFLDISRRDGREVANHFKWLANVFPVTFLFVGVGLRARGAWAAAAKLRRITGPGRLRARSAGSRIRRRGIRR